MNFSLPVIMVHVYTIHIDLSLFHFSWTFKRCDQFSKRTHRYRFTGFQYYLSWLIHKQRMKVSFGVEGEFLYRHFDMVLHWNVWNCCKNLDLSAGNMYSQQKPGLFTRQRTKQAEISSTLWTYGSHLSHNNDKRF